LEQASSIGWIPLFMNAEVSDNPIISAQQAKIAKVMPHKIQSLAEFDYLFYKDDKVDVSASRMKEFVFSLDEKKSPLSLRKHPFLDSNVLHEFGEAMLQPRYKAQWVDTVKYITKQVSYGYKLESDTLYATGALLRNMRHADIQKLNENWYSHIEQCGIECQISFHFIAQIFPGITLLPDSIV